MKLVLVQLVRQPRGTAHFLLKQEFGRVAAPVFTKTDLEPVVAVVHLLGLVLEHFSQVVKTLLLWQLKYQHHSHRISEVEEVDEAAVAVVEEVDLLDVAEAREVVAEHFFQRQFRRRQCRLASDANVNIAQGSCFHCRRHFRE